MPDVRLAFEEDNPPLRLMLPEGLTDTALAEFAAAVEHTGLAEDPVEAAAALLALRDRLPSVDPVFSEPTTLTLVRCSLQQLAARRLWQVDEHERSRVLLLGCVEGLAEFLDTGGDSGGASGDDTCGDARCPDVMALWLSARFDLYWGEVLAGRPDVGTDADLATTIGTTLEVTRDGRLDVRSGFGLLSRWVGFFSSIGLSDFALMLREHLVDLATERFGPLDPVTLALRHLEAEILDAQGHLEQAWERFEHLLRDLEHTGETGGVLAMQVRSGHAFLAGTRGSSDRAVQLYRELLADLEAGLLTGDSTGPFDIDAPMAGTSYMSALDLVRMNLSTWLTERGELEEVVPLLEQVVERVTRTALEPDEPFDDAAETLRTVQHDLGVTLRDLGRHEESMPQFRALLAGWLSSTMPDEAQLDDAYGHLMYALLRTGDHEGARTLGEVMVAGRSERLGMSHPSTVLAAAQLAAAECALGDDAALAPLARSTQELVRALGSVDVRTLLARILVQSASASAGIEVAVGMARDNLADCLEHLGPGHFLTRDAELAVERD